MRRRWRADASAHIVLEEEGPDGLVKREYPVVTAQDMAQALTKLAVVIDALGGHGTISSQRIPTGVPDESVTTAAVVTWMAFTDSRPRPEPDARDADVLEATEPVEDDEPEEEHAPLPFGEPDVAPDGRVDQVGDGLYVDLEGSDTADLEQEGATA